jgi:uncharacterized membrane protein
LENIMVKTIIGSFDSVDEVNRAVRELRASGFMESDINLVANNVQGGQTTEPRLTPAGEHATATGALTGGAIGGAAGLAVSLMGLAIPGIGPILAAGPIVAALAGVGAGAVAGGLIGSLTEMGIEKSDAEIYAEAVRRGGSLLTVRADESRAQEVTTILKEAGAIDVERRAEEWQSDGWKGYDSSAKPYTFEEIEHNRARYRSGDIAAGRQRPM